MKKITTNEKDLKKKYLYSSLIQRKLSNQKPAIFFDRDGVLIKDCNYISSADKVEIDMLTKYSKIFTFDDNKIKIEKINK